MRARPPPSVPAFASPSLTPDAMRPTSTYAGTNAAGTTPNAWRIAAARGVGLLWRVAALVILVTYSLPTHAQDAARDPRAILDAYGSAFIEGADGFDDTEALIDALGATGDRAAARPLRTIQGGDLYVREADGAVFAAERGGVGYRLSDPITGAAAGEADRRAMDKVRVRNSLRRRVDAALSSLTLRSERASARLNAAATIFRRSDSSAIEALDAVIPEEADPDVRLAFEQARAAALLSPDAEDVTQAEARGAIAMLEARGDRDARTKLAAYARSDAAETLGLAAPATAAVAAIDRSLALWSGAQNVWYGVSLGSVLFLAAIGLAITFGVMGVINMAHGEMVMLGAYTTFAVQETIRVSAPGLFDVSLLVALPLAFLVAGLVGLAMERGIIRFLYGRPLETLLATWGVSLILQQAVRTIFGPNNREVGNPSWMSGSIEVGQIDVTLNRLWIVLFSLAVFAALLFILKRTSLGLRMRAVTQNRRMAASVGIRTPWVDAMTFALGSGIAGVAGVALSQIGNVSPNLGQSYIIDSFLVVVFGGVGNLWGTLVGAMSLGIVNKLLEPYAGAVLGKVVVLVLVILFIQRRPRGLFALRGRAVEA